MSARRRQVTRCSAAALSPWPCSSTLADGPRCRARADAYADGAKAAAAARRCPAAGTSYDYEWDAAETGHKDRAWSGRAFVHQDVAAKDATPLLVFLHGLNRELIKNRCDGRRK